MSHNFSIIIVDKSGNTKSMLVKDYKEEELYKKCGFKKPDGFVCQTEWKIKLEGNKYQVYVFAKTDGKANSENKYDFPPPIDTKLFFGSCAIICKQWKQNGVFEFVSFTLPLWEKMYEKLFGGFENLDATCFDDEEEIDELDAIPKSKKTKHGYLKDGFVVDSDKDDEFDEDDDCNDSETSYVDEKSADDDENEEDKSNYLNDIGSELSEEAYDYSDSNDDCKK